MSEQEKVTEPLDDAALDELKAAADKAAAEQAQKAEKAQQEADEAAAEEAADEDPVAALQNEVGELKQRLLRQQADFDNIRKRLRREADQAGQRKIASFVRPLLTEMDNFELALTAADPSDFQNFVMGVSMIRENVLGMLNSTGIELINAEGIFDPAWHEVVAEQEDPEQARGTILQVHRQGYKLGDQIIRAAQVVVAKPPAEAPAE